MKKLMVALAAVAMAAGVNAASVNWSGSTAAKSGVTSGYYAVLIDASGYADINAAISAIMADGASATGVMQARAGTYVANNGMAMVTGTNLALPASYVVGSEMDYWSILFDGSVGANATAQNYYNLSAADKQPLATAHGKVADNGKLVVANMNQTYGAWTAVAPEPTSGLLLLIGMAGLALRRRHA